MMWWDRMPWSLFSESWALSQLFSLSPFTFIKRLFRSASLSAIRRVVICISEVIDISPGNLDSSSCFIQPSISHDVLCIQVWHTPFPICNQSVVPCLVLSVASWPAYRFLRRQVRWSDIPISLRIFQFIVIHTVKGSGIVNKAEIDVFLELSCFFHDPVDVGNLVSGSSAFSKTSLNIRKFMVHPRIAEAWLGEFWAFLY